MDVLHNPKAAAVVVCARARARALLALLFVFAFGAACVRAQVGPRDAGGRQQAHADGKKGAQPAPDEDDDEEESESSGRRADAPATPKFRDPAAILRNARFVLVRSDSVFVSGHEVEDSLRKRKEFRAWGMVLTRNEAEADLFIEITRKPLTRRFTFSVIDPRTMEVVASGKTRSVIFGKKIANKVAEKFANRVKVYRPYPPASSNP